MEKRTISLPDEHAAFIDSKVQDGSFASASEVVRAGLRALKERDAAVEKWLMQEVAPVYDAMEAEPDRGIPSETVFKRMRTLHAKRLKDGPA